MRVYFNQFAAKDAIMSAIDKYGSWPEHQYYHYNFWSDADEENVYFDFGNNMGIMATINGDETDWSMFTEPFAPPEKRVLLFKKFLRYLAKYCKNLKKVYLETSADFRKQLLADKKINEKYQIRAVNEIYWWPLFDMKTWDGDKMEGKKWKRIRNTLNKFYAEHKVEVVDSCDAPKDKLRQVVADWQAKRGGKDTSYITHYNTYISHNFQGTEIRRTLIVDGEPCSITCGWKIPNSHNYYSGIGITNYKYEGLGEAVNMDDLTNLKKCGYNIVDFGGGGKELSAFKKKFHPAQIYKTYNYTIVPYDAKKTTP